MDYLPIDQVAYCRLGFVPLRSKIQADATAVHPEKEEGI